MLVNEVNIRRKVFWNYVNPCRKSNNGMIDLRSELGECIGDDRDKANVLTSHYAKVFIEDMAHSQVSFVCLFIFF